MSLKVIETGANQKLGFGFLFAFYSNYGAILYRLRHIGRKSRFFYTPPVFDAPAEGDPDWILWRCLMPLKLEWFGATVRWKKLWQYVKPFLSDTGALRTDGRTDRRTDRQTDRIAISISRVSVLTRDKNGQRRNQNGLYGLVYYAVELKL